MISHLKWLEKSDQEIKTSCGKIVEVYKFSYDQDDNQIMSEWATHFRNQYCRDKDIPFLKSNKKQSNGDFLLEMKFPDRAYIEGIGNTRKGPATRAGDFTEIMVADYLEFICSYSILSRIRYDRKNVKNQSSMGSDVVGFKLIGTEPNIGDELVVYEVKAHLSDRKPENLLDVAIKDSIKDEHRVGEALFAARERAYYDKNFEIFSTVDRFQNFPDFPYTIISGASAFFTTKSYDDQFLNLIDTNAHPNRDNLKLLVIYADDFMKLTHALYERAAHEA